MKIREIMRPGPITILETDSLGAAQRVMARSRIRHLPVISDNRLVGMLSARDILAARAHCDGEVDWWSIRVHDAMTAPVHTAGGDDSLAEIAGRMAIEKIGAMPVVERGKLLGLVTVTDVLDAEVRTAMAPAPVTLAIAADAMTPFPLTTSPQTPIADAVAMMVDHHVRHLPVVDTTSTVIGMLSERDVRSAIGDPVQYVELKRSTVRLHVRDVMTTPAVTVPFDRPLVAVAKAFADTRIGAVPVLDKFGALVGIISYVDALRGLT
ncbi:MAG TPA: CBS domain-containing protein [Kofleriaceae bacterium]